MSEFVAIQLVHAVTTIGALITLISEVSRMFPHMDVEIVLPFSDVSTFSAHKVLVVGVSEHMSGEVGLVSAPEITQATLVGLLTTVHQHVSIQATFMRGHITALRTAMDLFVGVQMSNVLLELNGVECDERAKVTAELVSPWVAVPLVLEEKSFIGGREIAL